MAHTTGHMLQNRYRIVSQLGQGGMGTVYRAWDTRLNVPVALKEMVSQPGLDPQTLEQLRQQFRQEAQVLARLHHPHLVRVGDFFEEEGNAYLVMDFVEGESLADRIGREGALNEAQVLELAYQLLDALTYCHGEGIFHRDIKPQNVIMRPDGKAILVDFGLVKLWDPDDPHTKTVMRGMGTPEYAPPEQYDLSGGHTDARSDIYSLGATLYHALSGQAPPTATMRIVNPVKLQPLRTLAPEVSQRVEMAIERAMELRPDDRFQSMEAMKATLSGEAVTLASPTVEKRGRTKVMPGARTIAAPRTGLPTWVWAAGLAIAALVVGGLILRGVVGQATSQSTPTPSLTPTSAPTQTSPPPPTSTPVPTATPIATPTPSATPIATPTPNATGTPEPTSTPRSTPTLTPPPTATATATSRPGAPTPTVAPRAVPPAPVAPSQGSTIGNPITLEWGGSLGAGQAYQVTLYHPDSGHVLQSELLAGLSWTVDVPSEKYGEWRWRVSVLQGGAEVTTSPEWMFWFNPGFGGGGEPSGPEPEPTR